MIQRLGILIDCLFFHSIMAVMIIQKIILNVYYMSLVKIKDFNALIINLLA